MRVHPTQLRPYGLPLERSQFLIFSSVIFLMIAMGSALSARALVGYLRTIKFSHTTSSFPAAAALLSYSGKSIVLLPKIAVGSDGSPSLSPIDLAFLREAGKIGTVSFVAEGETGDLPILKERSIQDVRALLIPPPQPDPDSLIDFSTYSRIFVPGHGQIYLISPEGAVSAVDSSGKRHPIEGE